MTGVVLGLALAVLASVALNGSYLLQHAGAQSAPAVDARRPLSTLAGLLRSRWWLAGLLAGAVGWAGHVGALAHAPLSLVQGFAAGGLALTVPVAARVFGQRLGREEAIAVGVLVAALALLGLGAGTVVPGPVPTGALGVAVVAALLLAGGLASLRLPRRRAHVLGAAGGVLYGVADAATKAATMAHGGLVGMVTSPWTAVVVLTSVGAFACFQRGLQIGPAVPVIALMTGATNAVAIAIGLLAFGEPLGATPAFAVLHLLAFGLAIGASLRLAAAQGRLVPGDEDQEASAGVRVAVRPPAAITTSAPSASASACSAPAGPPVGPTTATNPISAASAVSR